MIDRDAGVSTPALGSSTRLTVKSRGFGGEHHRVISCIVQVLHTKEGSYLPINSIGEVLLVVLHYGNDSIGIVRQTIRKVSGPKDSGSKY
jgi:hypothetical protein